MSCKCPICRDASLLERIVFWFIHRTHYLFKHRTLPISGRAGWVWCPDCLCYRDEKKS